MGLFFIGVLKIWLCLYVSEKKAAQAPRKEHFPMEQPADAVSSAVETQNVSAKEDNVVNKASSDSPQAILFPPIVSSGKTCEINLTNLHHDSRHPGVLIKYEKFIYGFHSALKNFH